MVDLAREFPRLHERTWLNTAAHGLLPQRARRALDAKLTEWERGPGWDAMSEDVDVARRAFARLIGARADEVAVQSNASSGVSAVMSTLRNGPRDTLSTTALDFPTSPYIAERQKERGFRHAHAAHVPAVDERTALACMPLVASQTGERMPAKALVERAHAAGAPVMLDGFQAVGTFPIDVKKLDVDFLVCGVYKWLMGAAGLAFLYVRRDHHARLPTVGGWLGGTEPYSFDPFQAPPPTRADINMAGPRRSRARRFPRRSRCSRRWASPTSSATTARS